MEGRGGHVFVRRIEISPGGLFVPTAALLYPALPYPILPCLALPYPTLPYPTLTCPVQAITSQNSLYIPL